MTTCTNESHEELRQDHARFMAETGPGYWQPDEDGTDFECRLCKCGSHISDGTRRTHVEIEQRRAA